MPKLSTGQLVRLSNSRTKIINTYIRTYNLHGLPLEVYVDNLEWISANFNQTSFGTFELQTVKHLLTQDERLTSQQKAELKRSAEFMHWVEQNLKVSFQPIHFNCNYCNSKMKIKTLYNRDSYCCSNSTCNARVGVHKVDFMPLGTPANNALRMHRKTCHLAFDRIWKEELLDRAAAYRAVGLITNWTRNQCHIGKLENKKQCDLFIAAAKTIWQREVSRPQFLNA